jgi:hypothetical protein
MMNAEIAIDGRWVDPATVAFDSWNFGRQADPPLPVHPFAMVADQPVFLRWFEPVFERVMLEHREDDERHGFEPLYNGATRLPTLDEVFHALAQPHRMAVLAHFQFEILNRYVDASGERLQWVGMSIDDIRLQDGRLHVDGLVRRPVRR